MFENLQSVEVSGVKFWNEEDESFFDFDFDVILTSKKIFISVPQINDEKFFDIPQNKVIEFGSLSNNDSTVNCTFLGMMFLMKEYQAIKISGFITKFNEEIEQNEELFKKSVDEICCLIENDGRKIAENILKLIDDNIMTSHDAVIMFQKLFGIKKYDSIKMYNENLFDDSEFQKLTNPMFDSLEAFIDLLEDEYSIESYFSKAVAWEFICLVSIDYYADKWICNYGKYFETQLIKNIDYNAKPDGTLDRYIESIISCNEINYKTEEALTCFTYYMMKQGYALGDLYFPAYFDICKQAFEAIGDNLRKNSLKTKLKGNVEITEVNYSIDDIDLMNGSEFESFISVLFSKMGYLTEVTKHSGDQGLDVIAEKSDKKIGIQAKCYSSTVGNSAIQEAVAGKNFYNCDQVIVVTNNLFTNAAIELAQVNDVILWDRNILKEKIIEVF